MDRTQFQDTEMESTGHIHCAGKVRRKRTVYTQAHLDLLLKTFHTNPYPGIAMRERLSHLIGVPESRIQVWFQNRRSRKSKKQKQEEEKMYIYMDRRQINDPPQTYNIAQANKSFYRMGHHELSYKASPGPVFSTTHFWKPNVGQSSSLQVGSSEAPLRSCSIKSPEHPVIQSVSSDCLSLGVNCVEPHADGPTFTNPIETPHDIKQECSLEQMLHEFQPCWIDVANNLPNNEDMLYLLQ